MTPAGSIALRSLLEILRVSRHVEVRPLAGMVETILVAEGLPVVAAPASPPRTSADRMRELRDRRRRDAETVTSDVTREGGVGGGVSSDLGIQSPTDHPDRTKGDLGDGLETTAQHSSQVTSQVTVLASRRRPSADKGSRLPPDWKPSEVTIAWAAKEHDVDAMACLDEFRDHWCALPDGPRARKSEWDRTFRNRVRERVRRGDAPMLPPPYIDPPRAPVNGNPAQAAQVAMLIGDLAKAKSAKNLEGRHG